VLGVARAAPAVRLDLSRMLEDCTQLLSHDLFQRVHADLRFDRLAVLVDHTPLWRGLQDLLVHRGLDHDARLRLPLPRQAGSDREGLLAARMQLLLGIPLTDDLHRRVLVQQPRRYVAGFPDGALHRLSEGNAFLPGEVQILREAVIAEVALLERCPALEHERVAERFHLADAGENPGQEVVPFENLPREAEALAGFLKACAEGFHGLTFPGRFSWIIQRWLHGPLRGPVGSSLR